ncbi:MAG: hypothetical protein A2X30_09330 [Elusimicrobia bacterium GWB2_63_16]|nr:MAG: hypothetical protein A2X30_09330 [Elusimicrobia bacterium GWB2_63_16]
MSTKFLMCTPEYYDIEYVINPWMDLKNKVDRKKAAAQWEGLIEVLQKHGASVEIIRGVPGLPDMTFAGDCGILVDGTFLASNFKHPERQPEREHYLSWLRKKNYKIKEIPADVYFEGLGDVIISGKRVVFGHGPRSHKDAEGWIKKTFPQLQVVTELQIRDDRFFHLAMGAGLLDEDTIIYYPKAFSTADTEKIRSRFRHAIAADDYDVLENIVCNNIVIGRKVIFHDCSIELRRRLEKLNFEVLTCDVSEFKKSGASLRCLVLNLN